MIKSINNSVAKKRREKNMTQEDLAKKVGVSRQTIIALEKGNYIPSLLLAIEIAHCFDVIVEEVFEITKDNN